MADWGNGRVRRIDAATGIITTVVGDGTSGHGGDVGPATSAQLTVPFSIAVGPDDDLYVAHDNSVRRVDAGTGVISRFAGTYGAGYAGDGGTALNAEFSGIGGLTVDASGNVFVSDAANSVVRRVDAASAVVTTVAGSAGNAGFADDTGAAARFNAPRALAPAPDGTIVVVDASNDRLRRLDPATGAVTTIAGFGTCFASGDGGPATAAGVCASSDSGLAYAPSGDLWFSDPDASPFFGTLRRIDTSDVVHNESFVATAPVGDNGPAGDASLAGPTTLVRDGDFLYVAERMGHRIRRIELRTGRITRVAGTGVRGSSGDNGPALAAQIDAPMGLALRDGALYFSAGDARIRRVDLSSGIITAYAGTGAPGSSGDGGPAAAAQFGVLMGALTFDARGRLFVADATNHRVRCIGCAAPGVVTTVAGTGNPGTAGAGGPAANAELSLPFGLLAAPDGALLVAEGGGAAVVRIDPVTSALTVVAGTRGSPGSSGDGGPATSAQLYVPASIGFDPAGNLIIADAGSSTFRRVDANTGIISRLAGGVPGYFGDGGPVGNAGFRNASTMTQDDGTHWFIADLGNGAIRRVEGARPNLITTAVAEREVSVGATTDLQVRVRNDGPGYATGPVELSVALPEGLRFVRAAGAGWQCTGRDRRATCRRDRNAAPSVQLAARITVRATGTVTGVLRARVAATSDSDDLNPSAGIQSLELRVRPPRGDGLHLIGADGGVFALGGARFPGSFANLRLNGPVNDVSAHCADDGWLVGTDGGVFTSGDAPFLGSLGGTTLNAPITGIASTGTGRGYRLVGADGGVFTFGDASFSGSLGSMPLNAPIVGIASQGDRYWLVGLDGGVFTFGGTEFHGSLGGVTTNAPVTGMTLTPSGHGYWLHSLDGGVFAFGDARFFGSAADLRLNAPVVALVPTDAGDGYWLVASDGGVFAFGAAPPVESLADSELNAPITTAF